MNFLEAMETFWSGERPGRIPYSIYDWEWRHTANDPRWQTLFDLGMGVSWHFPTFERHTPGVEVVESHSADGHTITRRTLKTDFGSIYETYLDGWQRKFLLETPEDYAVMTRMVQQRDIRPAYDQFLEQEAALGPHGVALIDMGRTPNQTILVDYVGLANFALHLYDFRAEMLALYEALLMKFRRLTDIVAEGPGRYVCVLENFTADTLGPGRYAQLLLPVYEECFPILQNAGKIVGVHYDGRLASCQEVIARAPIDLIESLTPPPEGDLSLAEARQAWPDRLFWSNINIACYALPPDQLKTLIAERAAQGAPDGSKLAFEVSEQLPANWYDSLRVVLETLRELVSGSEAP
jgi:hypothetical protein